MNRPVDLAELAKTIAAATREPSAVPSAWMTDEGPYATHDAIPAHLLPPLGNVWPLYAAPHPSAQPAERKAVTFESRLTDLQEKAFMPFAQAAELAASEIGPVLCWVHEWGAIGLPLGHPSRITCFEVFNTLSEAIAASEGCEFNDRLIPVFPCYLDEGPAEPKERKPPEITEVRCRRCKVDRLKAPCPQPHDCAFVGIPEQPKGSK